MLVHRAFKKSSRVYKILRFSANISCSMRTVSLFDLIQLKRWGCISAVGDKGLQRSRPTKVQAQLDKRYARPNRHYFNGPLFIMILYRLLSWLFKWLRLFLVVNIPWRSQAVPDEILENITPTVRSAFLSSVSSNSINRFSVLNLLSSRALHWYRSGHR